MMASGPDNVTGNERLGSTAAEPSFAVSFGSSTKHKMKRD